MQPWTFVALADIHVGTPRSYRFETSGRDGWAVARTQVESIKPDLMLIAGDLTRDGNIHRFELEQVRNDLDRLPCDWRVVVGNMDTGNKHTDRDSGPARKDTDLNVTSDQLKQFSEFFGPLWWTFIHKGVRFSGFPDMLCGSGLQEEAEFWRWLDLVAGLPKARHHVWMMHSALFIHDLHEPNYEITDREQYLQWYFGVDEPHRSRLWQTFKASGATMVLMGHVHLRLHREVEGIRFEHLPQNYNMAQFHEYWPGGDPRPGFMRYDVIDAGIAGTFIPRGPIPEARSYGPGGHPPPEARDYSIAWEKPALA